MNYSDALNDEWCMYLELLLVTASVITRIASVSYATTRVSQASSKHSRSARLERGSSLVKPGIRQHSTVSPTEYYLEQTTFSSAPVSPIAFVVPGAGAEPLQLEHAPPTPWCVQKLFNGV